jgi:crotonobetainyl-CoA:carnitine CoA-transferase CaiB-like acyl-CoA transferase
LVRVADAVVSALRPGVSDRVGIGAAASLEANPALVHCTVTGFGSTGPYSHLRAYDGVISAKSGGYGAGLHDPFRSGPIFTGMARPSVGAAHHVLQGVLAALVAREATGRGQSLEVTLFQGLSPYDYFGMAVYQLQTRHPDRFAGRGGPRVPGGMLCTRDGHWILPTNRLRKEYEALVRAVELDEVWTEPRFKLEGGLGAAPTVAREDDARALWDLVRLRVSERTLQEWQARFDAEDDLAAEWARTCEEALDHPQIVHNGHVVVVEDPQLGPVRQVGPIASYSRTPSRICRPAPALNEHHDLTLRSGPPPANTGAAQLAHPLSGLTIVEVGHHYAMPYAITMLAALGARVIKIEPPAGDHMRDLVPIPEAGGHKVMAGKESVVADLYRPEGRQIVYRLAARADVFALGLRMPAALDMGMDEASIRLANPDIVYFVAAGYGTSGPLYRKAMHAGTAGAATGALHRQAGSWLEPPLAVGRSLDALEELSLRFGNGSTGDAAAAASAASALMVAILALRRHGIAQRAETSMLMGNAMSYSDDFNSYAGKPPGPLPDAEQYGFHALYRIYPASSGWVFLACLSDPDWHRFCSSIDRSDLATDVRFLNPAARSTHDHLLVEILTDLFVTKDANSWETQLTAQGVGCVRVFEGSASEFSCNDPVLRDTGHVVEVDEPVFGPMLRHGLPITFSETPGRVAPGCWTGQHTQAVLSELGYTSEEIAKLDADGITATLRLDAATH